MASSGFKKVFLIGASLAAASLIAVLILAALKKRSAELRTRDWIVAVLQEKFKSDVQLQDFHVKVFPRMGVTGEGLLLQWRNADGAPPLIRIEKFSFDLGFLGIFRVPHRIQRIHLQHMVITIPPREQRKPKPPSDGTKHQPPQVIVDEIDCDNTELVTLSNKPNKQPLYWEIHNLKLRDVGAEKPFAFHGTLTNAKPKGEIDTAGQFGPWNADDPGATPLDGKYAFDHADLGPFPGIAGILSSTGTYKGQLDTLETNGQTDTPDFSLDRAGRAMNLHTDFSATVDGTNGDTLLHPVHALLGQSVIVAAGSVIKVPDQGHQITLDVTTPKARIEDILQLAINSDKPFLTGPVDIKARLSLPPGKQKVIDKMSLQGSFAILKGKWSSSQVREKLQSFSRHAQGEPEDEEAGSAVTDLKGNFTLNDGVIHFSQLTFSVPGAAIDLAGTYEIKGGKIAMDGHLRMQARLSQTVTGAKSFFLKAIDPFFAKNGAGTVLPISITGTQESPVIGVSVFHKKIEKKMGKAVQ